MRVAVFMFFLVFAIVADTRLMEALRIGECSLASPVRLPSFWCCAQRSQALWACLVIGLLLDFSNSPCTTVTSPTV